MVVADPPLQFRAAFGETDDHAAPVVVGLRPAQQALFGEALGHPAQTGLADQQGLVQITQPHAARGCAGGLEQHVVLPGGERREVAIGFEPAHQGDLCAEQSLPGLGGSLCPADRAHPFAATGSTAWSNSATRLACVGASGTCAGLSAASSVRRTGTTSSPSRSNCSSTVFSGSPAWSIRNSWRW